MGMEESVFDVLEMFCISVTCSKCLNGINFNAANGDTGLPSECPICHADFRKVGELLGQYRKFYASVKESSHTFQFRVRIKKHQEA